jgi:hypothetical protein
MGAWQAHNGFSHHFQPGKRMGQRHGFGHSIRGGARRMIGFYIGM